jgi:hypothetical protein
VGVALSGSPVSGALGLNSAKYYYVYDFWNDRRVGKLPGSVRLEQDLRPGEARMMSVHEALDHPQFISTNRHIMQGYIDLPRTEWDDAGRRLSGTSLVVGGETYKVIIATNGYRPRIATARHASAQVRKLNGNPELAELSIDRAEKGPVEWSITFSH